MFGLTDIAATVARTLPNGEKNAIRKTYKGHIKKLGVNGHFDVVKKEPGEEDSFAQILAMPEQEWGVHFVKGKEVEDGLSPAVQSNLVRAMTMAKGSIPKQVWDSAVLGELAPANVVAAGQKPPSAKPTAPSTPAGISAGSAVVLTPGNPAPARGVLSKNSVATAATNAAAIGASQQAQAAAAAREAERPKRNIKKRTYGDTSFEGYGEGFMDDDLDGGLDADGYDTGEGLDDRQKRRKKVGARLVLRRLGRYLLPSVVSGHELILTINPTDTPEPRRLSRPCTAAELRTGHGGSMIPNCIWTVSQAPRLLVFSMPSFWPNDYKHIRGWG